LFVCLLFVLFCFLISLYCLQSRLAHLAKSHAAKEGEHKKEGGAIISSLVFGGLDGVVTTFAVLVAAAAQNLLVKTLLILT
jgi:hypothetical protein